jgi:outer membrane protein
MFSLPMNMNPLRGALASVPASLARGRTLRRHGMPTLPGSWVQGASKCFGEFSPRGTPGRGRGEGEGFVRFSIASSILQVALIPLKIAKNRSRHRWRQTSAAEKDFPPRWSTNENIRWARAIVPPRQLHADTEKEISLERIYLKQSGCKPRLRRCLFDECFEIKQSPPLMRRTHFILVLSLALLGVTKAQAAPLEERRLSLEECVRIALEHNLDIKIDRYEPDIAQYNVGISYSDYDPFLDLRGARNFNQSPGGLDQQSRPFPGTKTSSDNFDAGLSGLLPTGLTYALTANAGNRRGESFSIFDDPILGPESVARPFENSSASVGITMRQPLLKNFWIDGTRLNIAVSKNRFKYSELTLRLTVMTTVRNVELAYYNLIQARENVKNQEKALELAERSLAENKKRVEVGAMAQLDEKQAASEVAGRRADLLTAQSALATQEHILKALLTDNYPEWNLVDLQPSEELTAVPQAFDLQLSWQRGLSQRPEILQSRLDVERQGIVLRYQYNQLFPQLDVFGSYGFAGSKREYSGAFNDVTDGNSPFYSVGGELRFPLGNRAARNNYKVGKANQQQILLRLKQLEKNTMVLIDDAVKRAQTALESVAATKQAREFAEAALDAEQKKLENGKSTSFVVLRLQRDLTFARGSEISALADYNKSLSELAFAEGSTLDRRGLKVEVK